MKLIWFERLGTDRVQLNLGGTDVCVVRPLKPLLGENFTCFYYNNEE